MQPTPGTSGESKGVKAKSPEPLPPLVSAALEPGTPTLEARLARLETRRDARTRYTPLGTVAQGGMGKVVRAWDEQLAREVALKIVPRTAPDGASEEERADHQQRLTRFLDEARITAQLDHPGIVPVHELGLNDDGAVYFVMPLVRGRDLKSVFELVARAEEGWTLHRAVAVMHAVCLTVAFAHQKGVVHRDLKPENIMVGPFGEAYVMDWGLALLLGRAERESIVGTPAYMAPEQATGKGGVVGAHSDVYSLGAILYELFARRVPHSASLETSAGEPGSLERILVSPPRPLRELREDVPAELAAICAKAMAAEPARRYRSAREMADDLAAWLAGRVVSVHETGPWARLRKWRGRNRGLALALEALFVLALVGAAAFFAQQRILLREVQAKNVAVLASAYCANLRAADLGLRAHEAGEARASLAGCDPHLRGWEWWHLALRSDPSLAVLKGHQGGVRAVAVSPDQETLATASDDRTVKLWSVSAGRERATLRGHDGVVTAVVFAPDGTRLASGAEDNEIRLWNVEGGELERVLHPHAKRVTALAFNGVGDELASGDLGGHVVLSRLSDGTPRARRVEEHDVVFALECLPEGELAVAYASGKVRILARETLELLREATLSATGLNDLAVGTEGTLAVAFERTAQIVDAHTLQPLRTFAGHGRRVSALAFAPDGKKLATVSFDNVVRVWDSAGGEVLAELDGHSSDVSAVAFFADGRRLVTAGEDSSVRLWDLERTPVRVLHAGEDWVSALCFSPDGRELAVGDHGRALRVFELESGRERARFSAAGIVDAVAWSARGELAFATSAPAVQIVTPELAPGRALDSGPATPRALCFDRTGARLFVRDERGSLTIYAYEGAALRSVDPADETVTLACSPDGELVALGTAAGEVSLFAASTGQHESARHVGEAAVSALQFSPDGTQLAVGLENATIVSLELESGRQRVLSGHEGIVTCLAFSPDGKRLASGSSDRTLRIWDPENTAALLSLVGHTGAITAVAFDPAGSVLASSAQDGSVRLWQSAAARELR